MTALVSINHFLLEGVVFAIFHLGAGLFHTLGVAVERREKYFSSTLLTRKPSSREPEVVFHVFPQFDAVVH